MPRLSLYKPEKGNDYKFIDRQAAEMFQVGGADLFLHKYLGPKNPSDADASAVTPQYDAVKETNIQDLLFLENRDRVYDSSIYRIRGVYNVQDIDFNLSQFGLFIDNDTVFMTVHINDFIKTIGRKPLSGDVIEVPNLRDEFALSEFDVALPKYFVISDVGRAAEGFSPTWYPHLYRLKLTKISNNQQYKDIFDKPVSDDSDLTLRDLLSTYNRELDINNAVIAQAEADAPLSGYETQHLYTLAVDEKGNAALETVDFSDVDASYAGDGTTAATKFSSPKRPGYSGYLLGDGIADNGAAFGHGTSFPFGAANGDYFLRTDFLPNRLFRFDGNRWVKREDAVRTTMTNTNSRNTLRGSFVNNVQRTGIKILATDVVRVSQASAEIITNQPYIDTMYATVSVDGLVSKAVEVSSNNNDVAVLTFEDTLPLGTVVEWKLYENSVDQKQAISKALKPRADL